MTKQTEHRSGTALWGLCTLMALAGACRLGGPAGGDDNPYFPDSASDAAGAAERVPNPSDVPAAMRADGDSTPAGDSGNATVGLCGGPFVSDVCDPVCNMGCPG